MNNGNTTHLFPHTISAVFLSTPPHFLHFRALAIPGCARSENSVCQTSHSDTLFPPLSFASANPPPHPPTGFHGQLPTRFFGPKAVFKRTSILLPHNHAKTEEADVFHPSQKQNKEKEKSHPQMDCWIISGRAVQLFLL